MNYTPNVRQKHSGWLLNYLSTYLNLVELKLVPVIVGD